MTGLLRLNWLRMKGLVLYLSLILSLLAYLLAAPIGPIKDGVLAMVKETPFLQKVLSAVLGLDLSGELTVKLLVGGSWGHPFLLACMIGFVAVCASRFPASEIEQGHIDLLMSFPVARGKVLSAGIVTTWGGLILLHLITLAAFYLGCLPLGVDAPSLGEMVPVAWSLLVTSIWMHALATLLSCYRSARSEVLGPILAFTLWSFVLGYIRPFVGLAETLAPVGLLHYYRPGIVMQSGLEWQKLGFLLASATMFYLLAVRQLKRRDLI